MRSTLVVLALAALLALPPALAGVPQPQVLFLVTSPDGNTALLTWTPPAGATNFDVYRGPAPDQMVLVERTTATYYVDSNAAGMYYSVRATGFLGPYDSGPGTHGGCVSTNSQLRVWITLDNCAHISI